MKTKSARDPIYGMEVDPEAAAATAERDGEKFYFCSEHCRRKFVGDTSAPVAGGHAQNGHDSETERATADRKPAKIIYTCPMHPQIEQDHPGNCPICGMTLEPKNIVAGGEEELHDMTRRFWVGLVLALPVFLLAMAHLLPHAPMWIASDASPW